LIQKDLLQFNTVSNGKYLLPRWFDERDYHWLHPFLDECRRFSGRPIREFRQRLTEPFVFTCPGYKLQLATKVIAQNYFALSSRIPKSEAVSLRKLVFAASSAKARKEDFSSHAGTVDVTTKQKEILQGISEKTPYRSDQVLDLMFSDLPDERLISEIPIVLPVSELILLINFELVRLLVMNAQKVEIVVSGQSRAFIRQAKLTGLICEIQLEETSGVVYGLVHISGPLAILRRTRIYGRALGNLFPFLARCPKFEARALLATPKGETQLILRSGDPFLPNIPATEFDSQVEQAFAKDFLNVAPAWDLLREPKPIACGKSIIFPDFALIHRATGKSYLLEIIGFWTEAYLNKKLAMLRQAKIGSLILCINRNLNCAEANFPDSALVIPYGRKICAKDVLVLVEGLLAADVCGEASGAD
jgi:predicted nuclease of restriction endonuclease-like RecB superfamily